MIFLLFVLIVLIIVALAVGKMESWTFDLDFLFLPGLARSARQHTVHARTARASTWKSYSYVYVRIRTIFILQ